jgi:hypothetical protein
MGAAPQSGRTPSDAVMLEAFLRQSLRLVKVAAIENNRLRQQPADTVEIWTPKLTPFGDHEERTRPF